jgi:hypothetical protein
MSNSPSAQAELYAALSGTAVPISDNEVLLMAHLSDADLASGQDMRHVMTGDVYNAFLLCQNFAPLAEHAQRIQENYPQLQRTNIDRVLQSLVQRGLLHSESKLRTALAAKPKSGSGRALRSMAIISPNHPAALEALLASIAETAPVRDRSFALVDLSEEAEHRARKVEMMAEFGRRTGQRVVLLEQKRERWLTERIAAMPEHADGLNLLFGKTNGARSRALNLIAASHAGERVLVLDDSHRMRTYGALDGALSLGAAAMRQPYVYANAEAAFSENASGPNLWDLGEEMLGRSSASLLQQTDFYGQPLSDFTDVEGAYAARMCLGSLGSADLAHSLWGFAIAPEQHASLTSREAVQHMLSGEAVRMNVPYPSLAPAAGHFAQGLDLTHTSGFAWGESQFADRSLSMLSQFINPRALELALPYSLERRGRAEDRALRNREGMPVYAARFISDHVNQLQSMCFAVEPNARLRWLAIQCLDLADAPAVEREALLWRYSTARRADQLANLQQNLINAHQAPSEPWRQELIAVIQAHYETLMQTNTSAMPDLARDLSPADGLSQYLRQYAQATLAWGALWEMLKADEGKLS